MNGQQGPQNDTPKSKFTYRNLNALSSSTPPKENPLRCVVLIDLDCFYAQVEQVRRGIPKDEPLAQLISSRHLSFKPNNSPARKYGIGRHLTATEAKNLCPEIHLAHVPTWREGDDEPQYHENPTVDTHKVSLDWYRQASLEILKIFRSHCDRVEKASIDESFLDLSTRVKSRLLERYPELTFPPPNNDNSCLLPSAPSITFTDEMGAIVSLSDEHSEEDAPDWDDVVLFLAAEIIRDIRREVEEKLGYTCSAGIAQNKMLAKLSAGWKKPNQQTVLRKRAVKGFLKDIKFTNIRNLGGKFGAQVASVFDTDQVSDIWKYSIDQLSTKLGQEHGSWVYNTCQGIDYSEVNPRTKITSMLSAKNFQPSLNTSQSVERWLRILTADLASRLRNDEDRRLPKTITIHHRHGGSTKSRQAQLPAAKEMDKEFLFVHAWSLWRGIEMEGRAFPANTISIAVSGFGDVEHGVQGIQGFLVPGVQSHGYIQNGKHDGNSDALGKRKRDDSGIAKFFPKKENTPPEANSNAKEDVKPGKVEPNTDETYYCPHCLKSIPWQQLEEHDDYHIALELSKESPARSALTKQLKAETFVKEETRGTKKKGGKPLERGQKRLEFGL